MTTATELTVRIRTEGDGQLTQLQNQLQNLAKQSTATKINFTEVSSELRKIQATSINSVNNLKGYSAAWREIANSVDIASQEFKQATLEADKLDKQLAQTQGRGGAGGIGRFAKITGAVAAGSVFGGAEGGIGALIGAPFGPTGAAAGAAIGAQVGNIRQGLTDIADYASEIARLRIALKGVSTDQTEFNNSLKFIQSASSTFLTGLGDTTKNYTQLQAAVRGAGFGANETQTVFKGLSAALIASGKGTEEINAAFLAASQVFSKGKVSAEELRGQIGERLPGAFTLFAQAIGKTPKDLDKALQEGQVTLEDFLKFSQLLFARYSESAKAIGESPFAASIRFKLAFDNFRLAAGEALQPIVIAFQNFGTTAFKALTLVIEGQTAWQKSLDQTYERLKNFIGGVKGLTNIISGLIKTLIVLGGVQAGVFVVTNLTTFSQAIQGIIRFTKELLSVEKALLAIQSARVAIETILAGLATGATKGKLVGALLGGAAGAAAVVGIGKVVDSITKDILNNVSGAIKGFNVGNLGGFGGGNQPLLNGSGADGAGRSKAAAREAAQDQKEKDRLAREFESLKIQNQLVYYKDKQYAADLQIIKAAADNNQQEVDRLNKVKVADAFEQKIIDIIRNKNKALQESADNQDQTNRAARDRNIQQKANNELLEARLETAFANAKIDIEAGIRTKEQNKELGRLIQDRAADLGIISKKEFEAIQLEREKVDIAKRFGSANKDLIDQYIALLEKQAELKDSFTFNFIQPLKQAYEDSQNLGQSLGSSAVSAVNGLSDAFVNFAATGKASFSEFARSVLLDLSRIFARFAILKAIGFIFPSLNLGGGSGGGTGPALSPYATGAAKGMVATNGIQPFAMGGIVNKPTLFKFASGGSMRNGLMGEAGPEAIMPLKRGADGKLGVAGGGTTSVVVNVDATGSKVEGDNSQAKQLGQVLSAAVQAELIKQKRPGGLLA